MGWFETTNYRYIIYIYVYHTPKETKMTMEKQYNLKMYVLLNMVIFQLAMIVCWKERYKKMVVSQALTDWT